MRRWRWFLLAMLVVGLAVTLVVESADDAAGRHVPRKRRVSITGGNFPDPDLIPGRFVCRFVHKLGSVTLHDYVCAEPGVASGGKAFVLTSVLRRFAEPPLEVADSWEGLARPEEFRCRGPSPPVTVDSFSCSYTLPARARCRASYTFKFDQMVSTRDDLNDQGEQDGRDRYYPVATKADRVVCPSAKPRPSPAPAGKAPRSDDDDDGDEDEGDD